MDLDYIEKCIGWARTDERSYHSMAGNLMGPMPLDEVASLVDRVKALEKIADAAAEVAMKYDDFGVPEEGQPDEVNAARKALYDLLYEREAVNAGVIPPYGSPPAEAVSHG